VIVAVASGKGGTGKTTIATNLAKVCAAAGKPTQYLDCDVEEPNGHIFLKPEIVACEEVTVDVPEVDPAKCTGCGRCGEMCQYSAIVCIGEKVLTFEQLCHSCGGCWLVCPAGAIGRKPLRIGEIETGQAETLGFVSGRLVAAINGADFVLLVTEPTPFGLNDLRLAVGLVREMKLPFAVAINRDGIGNDETQAYCAAEGIHIATRIPDDRQIAQAYSSGQMIVEALPEYGERFAELATALGVL
jgi:MinD superfamily P-loop ATPase